MRLNGGVELRSGLAAGMKRLQEVPLVRGHAGGAVGRCARAVACCGGPVVADFMGVLGHLAAQHTIPAFFLGGVLSVDRGIITALSVAW